MVEYDNIQNLADEIIPIAETYRGQMPESTRKLIKQVKDDLTEGEKLAAHLKVLNEDKKTIQLDLDAIEVRRINNQYNLVANNEVDIKKLIRIYKKKGLGSKVFFIRHRLSDLESKQGRLSKKRLDELTQVMIDENYYKGKKINLEKAQSMLNQDLDLIYELRADSNGYIFISSIKK